MLMDYPDVRINIPPLSVMKDEISVAGEKNGVLAVVEKIKEISKVLVGITVGWGAFIYRKHWWWEPIIYIRIIKWTHRELFFLPSLIVT